MRQVSPEVRSFAMSPGPRSEIAFCSWSSMISSYTGPATAASTPIGTGKSGAKRSARSFAAFTLLSSWTQSALAGTSLAVTTFGRTPSMMTARRSSCGPKRSGLPCSSRSSYWSFCSLSYITFHARSLYTLQFWRISTNAAPRWRAARFSISSMCGMFRSTVRPTRVAPAGGRWGWPGRGRGSCGTRRCSCSTETDSSSRSPRRRRCPPSGCRGPASPSARRRGSRSPRSRGTTGRPGRTRSPSSCTWALPSPRRRPRSYVALHELGDGLEDLFARERQAAHAVEADGVHQVLGAEHPDELTAVDLRHEHLPVLAQDVTEVRRQRVQIAEVDRGDGPTLRLRALDRRGDRAVRPAPADDEEVAGRGAVDRRGRDLLGHAPHLLRARPDHVVVVVGVVGDVARDVLLLDPTDPVLEPRRPGANPRTRERRRVAQVREEALLLGPEADLDRR